MPRILLSAIRLPGELSTRASSCLTQEGDSTVALIGLHRLQGRYPAKTASRAVAKKSTFFGCGLRAPHEGRQNIPVVCTPRKKTPSYVSSRLRYARCISARGGSAGIVPSWTCEVEQVKRPARRTENRGLRVRCSQNMLSVRQCPPKNVQRCQRLSRPAPVGEPRRELAAPEEKNRSG